MPGDLIEFPSDLDEETRENAHEAYVALAERLEALKEEGYNDAELVLAATMLAKEAREGNETEALDMLDLMADDLLAEDADFEDDAPPLEVE